MTALFGLSILARLPVAMLSIGLLVHTQAETGEYAAAGLVAGAFALAQGVGGPALGRAADRRGQFAVLAAAAVISATALIVTSVLPHDVPIVLRVALAAAAGAAMPPVGACFRALLPSLTTDLRTVYAKDTAAVEVTWVAGPPVVLALGAAVSTGAALAATGVLLAASTLAFAASRPSRSWRPVPREDGRGALRSPGLRTLVAVLLGVGCVFGATEVAVTAAGGHAAGPLLGLWGLGSLIAGLAASRLGGGARTAGGLVLLLGALGAAHAALALAGRPIALGIVLLIAGGTIAPTFATIYAMVDTVAPKGTATEAFAWLATASAVGASVGAAGAGAVVDLAGPAAAFAVAGFAAALAAGIAILRARTLPGAAVPTPQGATT